MSIRTVRPPEQNNTIPAPTKARGPKAGGAGGFEQVLTDVRPKPKPSPKPRSEPKSKASDPANLDSKKLLKKSKQEPIITEEERPAIDGPATETPLADEIPLAPVAEDAAELEPPDAIPQHLVEPLEDSCANCATFVPPELQAPTALLPIEPETDAQLPNAPAQAVASAGPIPAEISAEAIEASPGALPPQYDQSPPDAALAGIDISALEPSIDPAPAPHAEPDHPEALAIQPELLNDAPVVDEDGVEEPAGPRLVIEPLDTEAESESPHQFSQSFSNEDESFEPQGERTFLGVAPINLNNQEPIDRGPRLAAASSIAPEAKFAEANHPRVVDVVRAELLPKGGTVQIRLDPPELGALQVRIEVRDGVVTASFQTSNDEATRLLGHSLDQLRHSLERQGVSVDKLQVQQAPRNDSNGESASHDSNQQPSAGHQQQQEQQRRELMQRMWSRLAIGRDPFDMVA